jgi:uncharacterized protein YbbK (DUF523 family)
MTDREYLRNLRMPNTADPLRVLISACLTGITCGFDGSANGEYPSALQILRYDTVRVSTFCPEEFSFGSPREMCDMHGGNGFDVLDGRARLLTESGVDWTDGIIAAAEKMVAVAEHNRIELAVLMDVSAACGSQVIYEGNRFAENKKYQVGAGVCAALLMRRGFKVISQRDFASLELLYSKLDPNHTINPAATDHHEIEWYKTYFGSAAGV